VDLVAVDTVENSTMQQPCQKFEEYPVLLLLPQLQRNTCSHAGVIGYTIQLLKDQVDFVLKNKSEDQNFLGASLYNLLKIVAELYWDVASSSTLSS
jgi:hypothetical protein